MEEFVKVSNLMAGDRLARTIYNDEFKVLLAKGNKLTTSGINAIKTLTLKGCYIEHDNPIRREQIPLSEPLVNEDEKIAFIKQIKELFANRTIFDNPFDAGFKAHRKHLEDMTRELIRHLRAKYNHDNFLYETEDYTRTFKNWIYHHTFNTCVLSSGIAMTLGFNAKAIEEIAIGALYHDLGKASFGPDLYNKENADDADKVILRKHPEIMFRLLQKLSYPVNTTYAVWQHHEKIDGQGYPVGVTKDRISMSAQIVGLASAFDNLVTVQAYSRIPMNQVDALEYLQGCGLYSIECIRALFEFIVPYPIGSKVLLSNQDVGYVLKNTKAVIMRPYVISKTKLYDLASDEKCRNITVLKVLEN